MCVLRYTYVSVCVCMHACVCMCVRLGMDRGNNSYVEVVVILVVVIGPVLEVGCISVMNAFSSLSFSLSPPTKQLTKGRQLAHLMCMDPLVGVEGNLQQRRG